MTNDIILAKPLVGQVFFPNSFNFMQFGENLAKSYVGASPRRVGAPTSGEYLIRHCFAVGVPVSEILEPPLETDIILTKIDPILTFVGSG